MLPSSVSVLHISHWQEDPVVLMCLFDLNSTKTNNDSKIITSYIFQVYIGDDFNSNVTVMLYPYGNVHQIGSHLP